LNRESDRGDDDKRRHDVQCGLVHSKTLPIH
jgi:hypothetical protein